MPESGSVSHACFQVNGDEKEHVVFGDQYLMVYRLKDGRELGRQVPAVWVTKRGFKWKTCLIAESYLLESTVKAVDVRNGDLLVTFSKDGGGEPFKVRLRLIVREDLGLVFIEGVGLETEQSIKSKKQRNESGLNKGSR